MTRSPIELFWTAKKKKKCGGFSIILENWEIFWQSIKKKVKHGGKITFAEDWGLSLDSKRKLASIPNMSLTIL